MRRESCAIKNLSYSRFTDLWVCSPIGVGNLAVNETLCFAGSNPAAPTVHADHMSKSYEDGLRFSL